VNTIGAFGPGDTLSTTPETLRLMIDVNQGSALWLSRAVAAHAAAGFRPAAAAGRLTRISAARTVVISAIVTGLPGQGP
jgi:NAD(P)-dependent dehydrogenase (short-subunit alcohol dehydrogenase family)